MEITGYCRPDGQVGIRNHVVILSSVVCANRTVEMIASQVPEAIPITHPHGCGQIGRDKDQTIRTLVGFGKNPNVAAVLVVGLGCETVQPQDVAKEIATSLKPVASITIQKEGGTLKTVARGVQIVKDMVSKISIIPRETISFSDIILGTECGGSDTTSGLAANPATGVASDLLVEAGGTVILSETTELIGAEHLLAKRAKTDKVAERIYEITKRIEKGAYSLGVDIRGAQPSPGNMAGGLTTIEEKSLGCIYKAGTKIINQVVEYGERPQEKGLVIMDTPGHDIESITGMIAGGAQLIVFTSGRGTPTGAPICPVVKVCGNPETVKIMEDNIDIDASEIFTGQTNSQEVGKKIFAEYVQVINGKQTKAEILGQRDFAIYRVGPTL